MDEYERLEGKAKAILFANEDNGYTVMKLDCGDGRTVTVVGCIPYAAPGEFFDIYGTWTEHPSYGKQFKYSGGERWLPQDAEGIREYLSSRTLDGVGEVTGSRIVELFGDDSLHVIADLPERLTDVRGITINKAKKISEQFNARMSLRRIMEFSLDHGLTADTGLKLYRRMGERAIDELLRNPYLIVDDFFGVPFGTADAFARDLGLPDDSPLRFEAAVRYVLIYNLTNGHVFIPFGKLSATSGKLLEIEDTNETDMAIERLVQSGEIVREQVYKEDACYLASMREAEEYVAERLYEYAGRTPVPLPDELFNRVEQELGMTYGARQREAIKLAATRGDMVLTGGPGTGKTTAVKAIVKLCEATGRKVALAAPTGRAAKRLGDVCGAEAKTIHRLLETVFSDDKTSQVFMRGEENPLEADVLIVDELSMVDLPLMRALLEALPPASSLVMVGDADQLPSVGPGNVLREIISSGVVPSVELDEIFRQARDSMIVMNAHVINKGEMPSLRASKDFFFMKRATGGEIARTIVELCRDRLPKYYNLDPSQIQVIAPSKKRENGTFYLNRCLQLALNPPSGEKTEVRSGDRVFRLGDRVMQTRNNYDIICRREDGTAPVPGVYNGDIAVITNINTEKELVTLRFDDDRLADYTAGQLIDIDLAYAVTVHKSQGSEYPAVVLSCGGADNRLLTRSLLYTAVTRAKGLLVVVGQEEILKQMVENNIRGKRYCALSMRLKILDAANKP